MLQQTQVATVVDYYHRFLKRFPTVEHLAMAEQSEVLAMWSGLGYYRRAKSLHTAARQVMETFDGRFPIDATQILSLAGIGRYTAGAIASFAYDQPTPILEANTIRLFSRLLGLRETVSSKSAQTKLWAFAQQILPRASRPGSGTINQAVMELGSLICTPVAPKCSVCPLGKLCQAHQLGIEHQIPLSKPKSSILPLTHIGVIIRNSKRQVLMRQNAAGQWWEGLWDLPWIALSERKKLELTPSLRQEIAQEYEAQLGLACRVMEEVAIVRHAVTKYRIRYLCVSAKKLGRSMPSKGIWSWFSKNQWPPLSARFRRIDLEVMGQ